MCSSPPGKNRCIHTYPFWPSILSNVVHAWLHFSKKPLVELRFWIASSSNLASTLYLSVGLLLAIFLKKNNVKLIRALIEFKKNNNIEIPVFFEKLFNAIYQCLWVKINPKSFSPSLASILLCFIYFINLLHSLEVSLCSVETGEVCKGIIKELLRSLKDLLTWFQLVEIFSIFLYSNVTSTLTYIKMNKKST